MVKIIAEIGSVHDGSFGNAKKLIQAAKNAGADFVKFQTHIASAETTRDAPSPAYFKDESRFDYFNRISFDLKQYKELIRFSNSIKIKLITSPFSIEAVKIIKNLKIKIIKIPSGELTNFPMLDFINKNKFEVILSTGMSNYDEITEAINRLKNCKLTLMQCTSLYPCPNNSVGINVLEEFKNKFNLDIGFSDHTEGYAASIVATYIGSKYIEKHITFSKMMYGSDAKFAMEFKEFEIFCREIRNIDEIKKNPVNKNDIRKFNKFKNVFQKSIYLNKDLKKNDIIKLKHLSFKKPDTGISAMDYEEILNKKIKKNLSKNHKFKWSDFK